MTVQELKRILDNVPDYYKVDITVYNKDDDRLYMSTDMFDVFITEQTMTADGPKAAETVHLIGTDNNGNILVGE